MATKVVQINLSEADVKDIVEDRVVSCFVALDMLTTVLVRITKEEMKEPVVAPVTKYVEGTKLITKNGSDITGEVMPNFKLPGDVCVKWETGETMSYDEEWLDEHTKIVKPLRLNQKINPNHPVFGEGYRMLEDADEIMLDDETALVSCLLSLEGDKWVSVDDFGSDLGKTVEWYREESEDADRWSRVFRRKGLLA